MNCEAVAWALAQDMESSSAKFLLVAIASRIEDGVLCASQAELGRIVKLSDRSVRTALKALERDGFIKRTPNPGKGAGRMADTISLEQPETQPEESQPEESATGKTEQAESVSAPAGKSRRTSRKNIPQQTEVFSAAQPEIITAEFVDISEAECVSTGARAQKLTLKTTTQSELNLQTPEQPKSESEPAAPAKVLNGTAKSLPTPQLAAIIVEHVNSRMLDPSKYSELNTTTARIKVWMDAGADFDADILPAIRDGCAWLETIGDPARRWKVFDKFVTGATKRRLAAEAPMNPIAATEATNDYAPRTSTFDGMDIRRGPVGPGSALLVRKIRNGRANRERGLEPHTGK